MPAIDAVIDDWAAREWAPWQGGALDPALVEDRVRALTAVNTGLCLYRIENGTVEFDPSLAATHPHCLTTDNPIGARSASYLRLLRDAVRLFDVGGSAVIAIHVNDLYLEGIDAPILFFQKPRGARGVLVPDIDFLITNHYADDGAEFHDAGRFADKSASAIFIGSTTGDLVLTSEHVVHDRNDRIRAAKFFRDDPAVTFALPNIVQVDNDDTRRLIESLGIAGQAVAWGEQFRHRYILSMDGNGATCSRVFLALGSNAVLVKYHSDNDLYYFHGLRPWQHYIPVRTDRDVVDVVAQGEEFGALHAAIAERSRGFAETYLSRLSVLRYTAALLAGYVDLFGSGASGTRPPIDPGLVDSITHVRNVGTVWTDPGTWSGTSATHPIEGFNLFPGPRLPGADLRYHAVLADGSLTPTSEGRQYCGSRGKGLALHGMTVNLSEAAQARCRIDGQVRFADGTVQPLVPGAALVPHPAPMTGFTIRIDAIDQSAPSPEADRQVQGTSTVSTGTASVSGQSSVKWRPRLSFR